jgi:glycosyltransferase involved in cell wall biosynthesis
MDEHAEFLRLVREFVNIAKEFRPDFIEVHTNWQLAIVTFARIIFRLDYSVVYVVHGYRHNYRFRSIISRFMIGASLYLFADHVITPCEFLRKKFGFLKEKNKVIFIGEDERLFKDCSLPTFDGALHFIFAGMFRTGKNQDVLIKVFNKYIDLSGNKNVKLYLPGSGPLLENCKQLVRKLGLEDNVIFPGLVNRQGIIDLYLSCQFAFAPTNIETFGHCITEPLILGRVLLTRHIGVADDIIRDGENGFFFDDQKDLLQLLLKILPDHALCACVAANAKRCRDAFRWELICQKRFDLIYNLPVIK